MGRVKEEAFIEAWKQHGSPTLVAKALGITTRGVLQRRQDILARKGINLPTTIDRRIGGMKKQEILAPQRRQFDVRDGHILIGSDAHYHPGPASTAHRAFLVMCDALRPVCVVLNGDIFDGASISRHARIGYDRKPTVKNELDAVEERLNEIEAAAKTRNFYWPVGNHDARFETFLAANAPQYEGVQGFSLKDRFPNWLGCWSLFVNDDLVIKHRFKSGIHAPHNNTMWAGRSIVTGHLHSLKVQPLSDYNGTRYGVDCGTMAVPTGDQFMDYLEDNPTNWRSGFVVITYRDGRQLWPQVVHVIDEAGGLVEWGCEVFKV
jgi:hypothetical protein